MTDKITGTKVIPKKPLMKVLGLALSSWLSASHEVRGPLKYIKEKLLPSESQSETNILDYVSDVKERMYAS